MAQVNKSVRDVRLGWAEAHPPVKTWLNKLSEGSARVYLDILYRYFEWLKENGKELAGKTPEE